MPAFLKRALFFCLFLSLFAKLSFAVEDKVAVCKVSYDKAKTHMLEEVDHLESLYSDYRMIEMKIRLLIYDNLWAARKAGEDPLEKETREQGRKDEEQILERLKDLDKQSPSLSNTLWESFKKFQEQEAELMKCCPEKGYEECIHESFKPVFRQIEAGTKIFDSIFERERDYRKKVEGTVGGKKGEYPEESLEARTQHKDLFNRFEMERRAQQFEDDRTVIQYFEGIRKMLNTDFAGDQCCYSCGKTDWEVKTDKLFQDS